MNRAFLTPPYSVFSPITRTIVLILCIVFVVGSWCSPEVCAQLADARNRALRSERENRIAPPSNSAQAMMQEMQASLKKLPWNDLSAAAQNKVKRVTSSVPIFHRMPQQAIYADPEIFSFLLQHPDLVIGFWETLGATQLSLREIGEDRFLLKETAGTTAVVEVLYRSNDLCIVYAHGEYRGPLIAKPYSGNVLLVLRTRFTRDDSNEPMVICDLDSFIQIDSLGADMLAKLFFASLSKTAENNFEVTISFVNQVSRAAARNPWGLKGAAEEISTIRPEIFDEFCGVVDRAELRFARRNRQYHVINPLVKRDRQTPMPLEIPVEVPKEKDALQDNWVRFSPPPDWEMDHLRTAPPFFDANTHNSNAFDEENDKLDTPREIESNQRKIIVPLLPKTGTTARRNFVP